MTLLAAPSWMVVSLLVLAGVALLGVIELIGQWSDRRRRRKLRAAYDRARASIDDDLPPAIREAIDAMIARGMRRESILAYVERITPIRSAKPTRVNLAAVARYLDHATASARG